MMISASIAHDLPPSPADIALDAALTAAIGVAQMADDRDTIDELLSLKSRVVTRRRERHTTAPRRARRIGLITRETR